LTRFFGIDKDIRTKTKENIYKVVIAATELAKKKTGALIVIERDIKLQDIADTGILINGEISPQLLVNIFNPKTPLHDGAVIISENKIVVCEGQAYRIIKVSKTIGEKNFIAAECSHVYNADASNIHIQNIPDLIGKTPSYVLGQIFKNTKFSIMTDSELTKVGLKRVDYRIFCHKRHYHVARIWIVCKLYILIRWP